MQELIFCLNATMPIFFMMILGWIFSRTGIMDESFVAKLNRFVFLVALPCLLFEDMADADLGKLWNGRFVAFCLLVTVCSVAVNVLISFLVGDRSIRGEFAQAAFRSNTAILGIAFIENIYGEPGIAPLMIIGTVPLFNVAAVVVLSFMKPEGGRLDRNMLLQTGKGIITNPIILGITAGGLWAVCGFSLPEIPMKTVHYLSVLATPLGLMSMGAGFQGKKALAKIRPAVCCSLIRLLGVTAVTLPAAAFLGFSGQEMVAILVMTGSSSAVSCYIMAKNMGHQGTLTSSVVMMTTLGSAFTLTGWLYLLRILELV